MYFDVCKSSNGSCRALCSNCPIEKNGMRMEAYVPNREENNMKICPNCHAVQQDHRNVCVDCGERLGAPVSAKEEKRLRGDMDAQMEKLYNQKDPLYTTKLDKTAGFGILLTMLAVLVLVFFLSDENRWYLVLVGLVFTLIGTAEAFFPKIGWELEKLRLSFSVNGTDDLTPSDFYKAARKIAIWLCLAVNAGLIIFMVASMLQGAAPESAYPDVVVIR